MGRAGGTGVGMRDSERDIPDSLFDHTGEQLNR